MTRQRQLIYDIVMASPLHMTAEEIYALARGRMPSVARGTVYRNLGILTEQGLVGKLEMPEAPARYDRTVLPHPHLICECCGRVEDVMPGPDLRSMFPGLEEEITGYDLKLFHVCSACKNKEVLP